MATKLFPKFSQGLANDPTTRRIWFGLAVAHDFESHDGMTEESLYQKIFASHFGQLSIIFLWSATRSLESLPAMVDGIRGGLIA
jgi:photosystem I P700 chlorophyll a apoprotein A2